MGIRPGSDLRISWLIVFFPGAVVMGQVNGLKVPGSDYVNGNLSLH